MGGCDEKPDKKQLGLGQREQIPETLSILFFTDSLDQENQVLPLCLYGIARTTCECEVGENRIVKKESETK